MEVMQSITECPALKNQKLHPKIHRKPLQPRNLSVQAATDDNDLDRKKKDNKKSNQKWIEISLAGGDSNKENMPISSTGTMETLDASLGEELCAMRKKLERMRMEKEKTERQLRERDLVLERAMQRLEENEKEQKKLEVEVELLSGLMDLRCSWTLNERPAESLREIERERKMKEEQLLNNKENNRLSEIAGEGSEHEILMSY